MSNEKQSKKWWKHGVVHTIGVLLFFIGVALAYFYPAVFEGRKLFQGDIAGASGVARDVVEIRQETGHSPLWTGSLFGGMPMYQIKPTYPSQDMVWQLQKVYQLQSPFNLLPGDSYLLFMLLLGMYILLRSCRASRLLSVIGALLWCFSSYFLILIDAGHIWKLLTLTYIPPTLAGLVLAFYRRKYLWGFVVTALFTALQILSNHVQMSYYFAMVMGAMVLAWTYDAYRNREWRHYTKALGAVLLGGVVGVAVNVTNLYHTYHYSKETMRGGAVRTTASTTSTSKGLDKEYITQWSYGIDEMLTFLIPDAKGGFTSHIGMEAPGIDAVQHPQGRQFVSQQNRYWGDQPFTSGPVYVGAFVLALAIFGFLTARGAMKWALGAVTLLTIMLSWGHNMMWLTDIFIDWVPMYNKFRTPSSILVVAELILPLFAVWALYFITREPHKVLEHKRAALVSIAITAGISLMMWLVPGLYGDFLSDQERAAFGQYIQQQPEVGVLINDLRSVRQAIFRADALRSLIIILLGALFVWLYVGRKIRSNVMLVLVALLSLIDLWSVDKRYLNDAKYLDPSTVAQRAHTRTPIDDAILADTTQYRVMNLTVNTFNDATTSYLHRSVGGYHAAKLQRYQDIIEGYLSQHNTNVLRALNTKYYIVPDSLGKALLITDTLAYGDAWIVDRAEVVADANAEYAALGTTPLDRVAVVSPPYDAEVAGLAAPDSLATIRLTSYLPDHLKYEAYNPSGKRLAVFSEIHYPEGWHVTINGNQAPLLRVDYLLRGVILPEGQSQIEMRFDPESVHHTEHIAWMATILLLAATLGASALYFFRRVKSRRV